jgi:hypothetical protein
MKEVPKLFAKVGCRELFVAVRLMNILYFHSNSLYECISRP